jgi:two-component system, sensor histidine kinase
VSAEIDFSVLLLVFLFGAISGAALCTWVARNKRGAPVFLPRRKRTAVSDAEQRARASMLELAQWIAAACHDLRQPTRASSLYIHAAQRADSDAARRDHLTNAQQATDALNAMIQDMLDLADLSAGKLVADLRPVAIESLFSQLRYEFFPTLEDDFVLRFRPTQLVVLADADMLLRMLRNLVANALRHASGRRVLVVARRSQHMVSLRVYDRGAGMNPELLQQLFRPRALNEAPATATRINQRKGHGIGLTVVQRFAALQSSELRVRSRIDRGSCFWFDLVEATSTRDEPAPRTETPRLDQRHVLLITSDAEVRAAATLALQSKGCAVKWRAPEHVVTQGLSAGDDGPFDLVIVDHPPDAASVSGGANVGVFDLVVLVRHELNAQVAVLVLQNSTQASDDARLHTLGSVSSLEKPIVTQALLDAVFDAILGVTVNAA